MKSNPPVLDSLLEAAFSHFYVCVSYVIAGLNSIAAQLQINHQLHRTEIVDKSHRSRDGDDEEIMIILHMFQYVRYDPNIQSEKTKQGGCISEHKTS